MLTGLLDRIDRGFAWCANPLLLAGRLLVVPFYLPDGIAKIQNYAGTASAMESHGLPALLLPLVILLEIVGPIFLALGLLTRLTCLALAVFSVLANVIFNAGSTDQAVQYLFTAEFAIVGGFLAFMAVGAGDWSLDALRKRRISS